MSRPTLIERFAQAESLLKQAQDILGEIPLVVGDIHLDEVVGNIDDSRRLVECILIRRGVIERHTDANCMSTVPACPTGLHD